MINAPPTMIRANMIFHQGGGATFELCTVSMCHEAGNLLTQLRRCLCADMAAVSHVGGALIQTALFQKKKDRVVLASALPAAEAPPLTRDSPELL